MKTWQPVTANTILYCRHWEKTVRFYRERLRFPVNFSGVGFVEFSVTESSRLSIADERKASIKSPDRKGITITFQVTGIETVHRRLRETGLAPTPVTPHAWNARVFYLFDPEGHRIEFWESTDQKG